MAASPTFLLDGASPTFLRLLHDERVRTVLIAGCGGGADFSHSANFFPALLARGKQLIVHSFSFGNPESILGGVPFDVSKHVPEELRVNGRKSVWPPVHVVDGGCVPPASYGPEVAMCDFLDRRFPGKAPKRTILHPCAAKTEASGGGAGEGGGAQTLFVHPHRQEAKPRGDGSWWMYASYARDWTAGALSEFYHTLARLHSVDAILLVDGGSDSLMKGDEDGLGDPIEDACSVAAVASLPNEAEVVAGSEEQGTTKKKQKRLKQPFVPVRVLVALGFGCDRFNGVTDRDSLSAIAELTRASRGAANGIEADHFGAAADPHSAVSGFLGTLVGATADPQPAVSGFLGTFAIERFSAGASLYADLIEHIQSSFRFRSVIANAIVETSRGAFGSDVVPSALVGRIKPGQLDLWPLMSIAFAFDARLVMERSLLCRELLRCADVPGMYAALDALRKKHGKKGFLGW